MIEPTFDRDGYPTDETLGVIREWQNNYAELIAYVQKAWCYPDRFVTINQPEWEMDWPGKIPMRWWYLSTGGWSGNENLIDAMQDNRVFWIMTWVQSRRGGHYWFAIRIESHDESNDDGTPDELENQRRAFRRWPTDDRRKGYESVEPNDDGSPDERTPSLDAQRRDALRR